MRQRLLRVSEVKCNLCMNWCLGSKEKNGFFGCDQCMAQQSQWRINTENGDSYRILLMKQGQSPSKKGLESIGDLMTQDLQDTTLRWSRVCSLLEENDLSPQQLEMISIQIQDFNLKNQQNGEQMIDRLKNITLRPSLTKSDIGPYRNTIEPLRLEQNSSQITKNNTRRLRNNVYKHSDAIQTLRFKEDPSDQLKANKKFCKVFDQTKRNKSYQFFFDQSELTKHLRVYTQNEQSKSQHQEQEYDNCKTQSDADCSFRQFGTELDFNQNFQNTYTRKNHKKRERRSILDIP